MQVMCEFCSLTFELYKDNGKCEYCHEENTIYGGSN